MNFIVIGEPCVDLIHKADGSVTRSYGGILYSLISLAILAKKDTVYPVMNVGIDEADNILGLLANYPNIKTDGINIVDHKTRKVNLYYNMYNSGRSARFERSTEPTYTLEYDAIEKFLQGTDSILINMISGIDITLETFQKIRNVFTGYIHIDIHNLVMKTNPDGTREHTHLEQWREWCKLPDTVQMNEFEVVSLSRTIKNEYKIVEEILINLKGNSKGVVITRGKMGATGYIRTLKRFGIEEFFDIERHDVESPAVDNFVDSTGCGDVFASAFTFDFSKSRDFLKALYYATRIASLNATLEGVEQLNRLK
ncbi:MAG: carbohydrate kinase family protein [Ignavibacteria bacterium]